ncbi:MAG: hypothetical protein ACJAV5_001189 [Vicingaceae bacterium]|jgi:hypothetical protein
MQKIILSFLFVSAIAACKSNCSIALVEYSTSTTMHVSEVFTQQEVPGTEGEQTFTYLTIQFSERPTFLIDSLLLYYYKLDATEKLPIVDSENQIRINLGGLQKDMANPAMHKIDSIQLFYKKSEHNYRQTENRILVKDPIYLP